VWFLTPRWGRGDGVIEMAMTSSDRTEQRRRHIDWMMVVMNHQPFSTLFVDAMTTVGLMN